MKNTIAALCLLLFARCADLAPAEFDRFDARQVEGLWQRQYNINWVYHFSDGLLTQSVFDFNAEIVQNKLAYRTNRDTVFMRDLSSGKERTWTVLFDDENHFTATDTKPIGLVHKFERL